MDKEYASLPIEQKRAYIEELLGDLVQIYLSELQNHPLSALLQSWCTTPVAVHNYMTYGRRHIDEELADLIQQREQTASALLSVLTYMFLHEDMSYRSPNLHITFKNTDGSSGSIVVDNLHNSSKCNIISETVKLVAH